MLQCKRILIKKLAQHCSRKRLIGEEGHWSLYLSHAKRALYHLSYIPWWVHEISTISCDLLNVMCFAVIIWIMKKRTRNVQVVQVLFKKYITCRWWYWDYNEGVVEYTSFISYTSLPINTNYENNNCSKNS